MKVRAVEQKNLHGRVQLRVVLMIGGGGCGCILGNSLSSFAGTYMEMIQALIPSFVDFKANVASPFASALLLVVGPLKITARGLAFEQGRIELKASTMKG